MRDKKTKQKKGGASMIKGGWLLTLARVSAGCMRGVRMRADIDKENARLTRRNLAEWKPPRRCRDGVVVRVAGTEDRNPRADTGREHSPRCMTRRGRDGAVRAVAIRRRSKPESRCGKGALSWCII